MVKCLSKNKPLKRSVQSLITDPDVIVSIDKLGLNNNCR